MFHDGDLQSGIALAIQQAKSVACFVRDENEESDKWEGQWLEEREIQDLLARTTVLLRIRAGTQEAGFLSAFCPLSNIPTLVIIQNGKVLEFLTAGIQHDDFKSRLRDSLAAGNESAAPAASAQSATAPPAAPAVPPSQPQPSNIPPAPVRASQPVAVPSPQPTAPPKKNEEKPRANPKGKGKQKEEPTPSGIDQQKKLSAAAEAKQKKLANQQELERVQALIEADKVARRKRREEEQAARRAQDTPPNKPSTPRPSSQRATPSGQSVNLQVRLFDGSTLRSSFSATATLTTDIRPWVDNALKSSPEPTSFPPYNFKQILAPLPNRNIDVSDEGKPISDLDLYPSATLVLVPVSEFTEAYSAAGGHGILGVAYRGINGLWGLGAGAVGMVGGALGTLTGYGAAPAPQSQTAPAGPPTREPSPKTPPSGGSGKIRVRTLADQRAESGNQNEQWYNGNQLNFEPKKDENDE